MMRQISLLTPDLEDLAAREQEAERRFQDKLRQASCGDTLGRVASINTSREKGQRKVPVDLGQIQVLEDYGCAGDAHSSSTWHRQVSLLSRESIDKARARGLDVKDGDFAENFTVEGFAPYLIPIGSVLRIGNRVEIEISQIGKVCHTRCAIYYLAGDCIFPREGIFGVVLKGGIVRVGDTIALLKMGEGKCNKTPDEALAEVDAACRNGTL